MPNIKLSKSVVAYPDILKDGNTVGWYDMTDPSCVNVYNNLVTSWLDKSVDSSTGVNDVDPSLWYTGASYWTWNFDANWTADVSNKLLHSDGSTGLCTRVAEIFTTVPYKVTITVNLISGTLNFTDNNLWNKLITTSGTFVDYIVASSDTVKLGSNSFRGDVTQLKFERHLGGGHHLYQNVISKQPAWTTDGILFDGTNDDLKAVNFSFVQPFTSYLVLQQVSWTSSDMIWDGGSPNLAHLIQLSSSPGIAYHAGSANIPSYDLVLNNWGIVRNVIYGSNSRMQINNGAVITGDPGALNPGGFTLGGRGDEAANFANFKVKEVILRKVADTLDNDFKIYLYLKNKYFPTKVNFGLDYNKILRDGNTIGWYDYTATSTLSLTVDSSVSQWNDKLGSGRNLAQATNKYKPRLTATGIVFDPSAVLGYFTSYSQPFHFYIVMRQLAWSYARQILWFNTSFQTGLDQGWPYAGGPIRASGGSLSGATADKQRFLPVGTFGIVNVLFNGANSNFTINTSIFANENLGSVSMNAIFLNGYPDFNNGAGIEIKEMIVRRTADSEVKQATIYNYLHDKYSLGLQKSLSGNKLVLSQYTIESQALFKRMAAVGEPATDVVKFKIDNCIKSLKANNLFTTQFDVFVVLRGAGPKSVQLNWIKAAHDASVIQGTPVYNQNVGYSGANSGVFTTNYKPNTQAVLYTQNNACHFVKETSSNTYNIFGQLGSIGNHSVAFGPTSQRYMNQNVASQATAGGGLSYYGLGWICMSRDNSANFINMHNGNNTLGTTIYETIVYPSTGMPDYVPYLFAYNNGNIISGSPNPSSNIEIYGFGKALTVNQFVTLQNIMDTYFASL